MSGKRGGLPLSSYAHCSSAVLRGGAHATGQSLLIQIYIGIQPSIAVSAHLTTNQGGQSGMRDIALEYTETYGIPLKAREII